MAILAAMEWDEDAEIKAVRLKFITEREQQGMNQRELAKKAGVDQGHMSKIEDVDGWPMRDLAARIVLRIVKRGLGLTLSSFFAGIETQSAGQVAAPDDHQVLDPASSQRDRDTIAVLARLVDRELNTPRRADLVEARNDGSDAPELAAHRRKRRRRTPQRKTEKRPGLSK